MTTPLRSRVYGTAQRGVTLIELMISMVIGLVIIGTLVALYAGSVGSNRVSAAQTEMNEDAQYALRIITGQLRQAGYNPVHAGKTRTYALPSVHPVFGCRNGFTNATTATFAVALTCNPAASPSGDAFAVAYEADVYNTLAATGTPTNCIGLALSPYTDADTGDTFYPAENRIYVRSNTLYCTGISGPEPSRVITERPLVDNVERLQLAYGTAAATAPGATATRSVLGYLSADQLGPAVGISGSEHLAFNVAGIEAVQRWQSVVSVRVCLVLRSSTPVFEEPVVSYGCDTTVNPPDRYLRRAYVTTVGLRNRM